MHASYVDLLSTGKSVRSDMCLKWYHFDCQDVTASSSKKTNGTAQFLKILCNNMPLYYATNVLKLFS